MLRATRKFYSLEIPLQTKTIKYSKVLTAFSFENNSETVSREEAFPRLYSILLNVSSRLNSASEAAIKRPILRSCYSLKLLSNFIKKALK